MKNATLFLLAVLVFAIGWYSFRATMPIPPTSNNAPVLPADVYPLYPGVKWGAAYTASTTDGVGYRVDAQSVMQVMDIGAVFMPFVSYYEQKLSSAGWVRDMMREAGGPGGGVSVYTKGSDAISVIYSTTFHAKHDNAPSECPCDVQLSLVSSVVAASSSDPLLKRTYRDAEYGFTLTLPTDIAQDKSATQYSVDTNYTYPAMGEGNTIAGVKFTIPTKVAEGTNLSNDSYISVEHVPRKETCEASMFLYGAQASAYPLTEGVVQYEVASTTDAAVGNRYEETVYVRTDTSMCIAVRYMVHYAAIENFPAGTVQPFDRMALLSEFDGIRRTLRVSPQ
jgi:hypothetical protein